MMEAFFAALAGATVAGAIVTFLAKNWIETRLKESIKHEYDQKLARFRQELEGKQLEKPKIELVSELIVAWMANPPGETFSKEYRTRLNRLSFQASLWLPADLAIELSTRLQNRPDAKTSWELVLFARRLLTGDQSLEVKHLTFWGLEFEKARALRYLLNNLSMRQNLWPNPAFERTGQQRPCWLPSALRASAAAQRARWASRQCRHALKCHTNVWLP